MIKQNVDELEEKSIYVLREAKSKFKNVAALWSMGKDLQRCLQLQGRHFLERFLFQ